MKYARVFALCSSLCVAQATTGCSWLHDVTTNPSSVSQLLNYVSTFLQGAQALWSVIMPLLGSSVAPQANVQFQNAVLSVNDATAALEDAMQAAAAAQQSSPDFSTLIAKVQDAVGKVMSIVQIYSGSGTDAGSTSLARGSANTHLVTLQHQADAIQRWK